MSEYRKAFWILLTVAIVITAFLVEAEVRLFRIKRASEETNRKHTVVLKACEERAGILKDLVDQLVKDENQMHQMLKHEVKAEGKQRQQMRRDAIKVLEEEGLRFDD